MRITDFEMGCYYKITNKHNNTVYHLRFERYDEKTDITYSYL